MHAMPSSPLGLMADSTSADALPNGMDAYAGYVDGRWPSFGQICDRFYPRAHCISITACGGNARIADVEAGDLTPESGARWLARRVPVQSGGLWTPFLASECGIEPQWRPGLYLPESLLSATLRALADDFHALDRSAYVLWVARWSTDHATCLPAGWDAWQYLNDELANVDYSVFGPSFVQGGVS